MVVLVTDSLDNCWYIEHQLIKHKIEYDITLNTDNIGLETPYLIVDGVPLDTKRALKWIRGA